MTAAYTVYTHFDPQGEPLYVGSTINIVERTGAHRRTSDWWALVDPSRTEVTHHASHAEMAADEKSKIERLAPRFNRAGKTTTYGSPRHKELTDLRSFRVKPSVWRAASARAKDRGEKLSDVLRDALREYVEQTERRALENQETNR